MIFEVYFRSINTDKHKHLLTLLLWSHYQDYFLQEHRLSMKLVTKILVIIFSIYENDLLIRTTLIIPNYMSYMHIQMTIHLKL